MDITPNTLAHLTVHTGHLRIVPRSAVDDGWLETVKTALHGDRTLPEGWYIHTMSYPPGSTPGMYSFYVRHNDRTLTECSLCMSLYRDALMWDGVELAHECEDWAGVRGLLDLPQRRETLDHPGTVPWLATAIGTGLRPGEWGLSEGDPKADMDHPVIAALEQAAAIEVSVAWAVIEIERELEAVREQGRLVYEQCIADGCPPPFPPAPRP